MLCLEMVDFLCNLEGVEHYFMKLADFSLI